MKLQHNSMVIFTGITVPPRTEWSHWATAVSCSSDDMSSRKEACDALFLQIMVDWEHTQNDTTTYFNIYIENPVLHSFSPV